VLIGSDKNKCRKAAILHLPFSMHVVQLFVNLEHLAVQRELKHELFLCSLILYVCF